MHRARITRANGEIVYVESEKLEHVEEQALEGDTLVMVEEIGDILEGNIVYVAAVRRKLKEDAVRSILVTVVDKVFDGDETSQGRMLRAIQIAAVTGETTTMWKLADNSIVEVTLDELKEALSLSGKEMSKIWLGV